MESNASLKKQIASILEDANLIGNEYVAERLNEHGHKCTYRFREGDKEFLLKRAAQIQKKPSVKFKDWQNGNNTQKAVLFLRENKDTLQILYDINYLMKTYGYDAQKASGILFKDKKELPSYFYRKIIHSIEGKTTNYFIRIGYSQEIKIEYFIDYILPVLPESYLKGIENFCLTHENKLEAI